MSVVSSDLWFSSTDELLAVTTFRVKLSLNQGTLNEIILNIYSDVSNSIKSKYEI